MEENLKKLLLELKEKEVSRKSLIDELNEQISRISLREESENIISNAYMLKNNENVNFDFITRAKFAIEDLYKNVKNRFTTKKISEGEQLPENPAEAYRAKLKEDYQKSCETREQRDSIVENNEQAKGPISSTEPKIVEARNDDTEKLYR